MKVVFCGTPEFAVPALRAVVGAGHEVALVVTQPDRAAGRGLQAQVPAVKQMAQALALRVVQPEKIKNNPEFRGLLEEIAPDVILVVAYGRIIPQWMLDLPPLGNINLHGSLLPKYRGAAPIQWAVANGEKVTGVTTMRIDAGLDTGEMLLARALPIAIEDTAVEVYERLAVVGAELMVETLDGLAAGTLHGQKQDNRLATLAPMLTREDGWMDFSRTAQQLYDRWRGFQPWPGAHTIFRGRKLIVHRVKISSELPLPNDAAVGNGVVPDSSRHMAAENGVLVVDGDRMRVGCEGGTMLELVEVQIEGKKRLGAGEFLRGYQVRSGERLGL